MCGTTKKSGKLSCCARGGAWFKNCGDAGDMKFDHTWVEGIQACKRFARVASGESPLQFGLRSGEGSDLPLPMTQSRNTTQQKTHVYRPDRMCNTDTTDCADRLVTICVCVLFAIQFRT